MKKAVCLICTLAIVLFSSCAGSEKTEIDENAVQYFSYDNPDISVMGAFAVSENGGLITAEYSKEGTFLNIYDENGGAVSSNKTDYVEISDIEVKDGSCYIAYTDEIEGCGFGSFIDRYDIESGEKEIVGYFKNLDSISSFCFSGEDIYAIGTDCTKKEKSTYLYKDRLSADNGGLGVYMCSKGEVKEVEADFPFAIASDGENVVLYGCSNEEGYYFAKVSGGSISGICYTDKLGEVKDMSLWNGVCVLHSNNNPMKLCVSKWNEAGFAEIMPNVIPRMGCKIRNNYCYYDNIMSGRLERIYLPAYYKGNKAVKMLCSSLSNGAPFGCGYDVITQMPEGDEMALKVLSRDRDYDICYLNSRNTIAGNIRDKGSFYPLNETPGIKEYLDECFPYLKEAAIDENGNIWMIPVKIDAAVLTYNSKNTGKYGVDLSKEISIADFKAFIEQLCKDGKTDNFSFNSYTYIENYITEYLQRNSTFDTEEFRKNAEFFKERMNYSLSAGAADVQNYIGDSVQLEILRGSADNYFAGLTLFDNTDLSMLKCRDLSASPAPYASENPATLANITIMCVNPDSDNLSDTLDYISTIAQYTLLQKNTYLFADKSKYEGEDIVSDIYDIFSGAKVGYAISAEIYKETFDDYLSGKISLEGFIEEADRKLKAYFNE